MLFMIGFGFGYSLQTQKKITSAIVSRKFTLFALGLTMAFQVADFFMIYEFI